MVWIQFSFSYNGYFAEAKEPNLLYYLPIAGERTDGFMPFPKILMWSEKQITSSRIWTQIGDFLRW